MTVHEKRASELFRGGCSCSQAVFAAFSDITGIDEPLSLKMSSPFGAGFGRMREVCGAVSGMCLAAGCLFGCEHPENKEEKTALYEMIHSMIMSFKAKHGSYICRELLGIGNKSYSPAAEDRTPDFYSHRPCEGCVMTAARLLDKQISEREPAANIIDEKT